LDTFLTKRDEIEATAFAIQGKAAGSAMDPEAQKKPCWLYMNEFKGCAKLLEVAKSRKAEIKKRHEHRRERGHWKTEGSEEWKGPVQDWLAGFGTAS
jgi:hypothetical protein